MVFGFPSHHGLLKGFFLLKRIGAAPYESELCLHDMGCVVILAVFAVVVNLLVDLAYAFMDPRIRSQYVKVKLKVAEKAPTEAGGSSDEP